MKDMVLTKMIGWGLVVVVWAIYAIKQALIRDFIGTLIAVFILVLGVVCFRGNRKKWKAMRAEKKAAKEKGQTGGDNITPFPAPEAQDEEETSAEEAEEDAGEVAAAAEEPQEEASETEEPPVQEEETAEVDEVVE